jgi:5-methylcytosine-specific restriction enzyme A
MAWEGSTRRQRLPSDWRSRIVPRIMRRDNHRCQWPNDHGICGWQATDIDHKQPGDNHSDDNLWALCSWHHDKKTAHEGNTARRNNGYIREKRTPESHPGIINN